MRCWFHVRLDISGVGAVAGEESFPTLFEDEGKLVSLQAQRDSSVVDRGTGNLFDDLLAALTERRQIHSRAVACKVASSASLLAPRFRSDAIAAATLHDIGYAYPVTGFDPIDGARLLAGLGFSRLVCHLVAQHTASSLEADSRGMSLSVLNEFSLDAGQLDPVDIGKTHGLLWCADLTTVRTVKMLALWIG